MELLKYFNMDSLNMDTMSSLYKKNKTTIAKVIGAGVSLYAIRSLYVYLLRKYKKYPPGPIGLPFVGNWFSALNLASYAQHLATSYGTVTMIYMFNKPYVFLHSLEAIDHVMNSEDALGRGISHGFRFSYLKPFELDVASAHETLYWPQKRELFQSVLLARVKSDHLNAAHNYSLLNHVFPSIEDCISKNVAWDFTRDINDLTFHSYWHSCFGTFVDIDSPQYRSIMSLLIRNSKLVSVQSSYKLTHYIEQQIYEQLGYDESVFDMIDEKWKEHFFAVEEDDNACAISKLIAAHHAHPQIYSTKNAILLEFAAFFANAIDTSVCNAEYGLVLLAKYPQIQQKIYEEVKAIFGDHIDDVYMETVKLGLVINKLHYLRAFVQEVLRLACVAPLGGPRLNRCREIQVKGKYPDGEPYTCVIPKGSRILTDVVTANKKTAYWTRNCNDKPDEPCLEAWLDNEHRFEMKKHHDKMVSFGIGKRNCAGMTLALRNAYFLFAKLLLRYEFSLANQDVEIKQTFYRVYNMDPKIPLKVKPRQ